MSESTVVPDSITPRCAWCGGVPASAFRVAMEHGTVTEDVCHDCKQDAWQAVMRVRNERREAAIAGDGWPPRRRNRP